MSTLSYKKAVESHKNCGQDKNIITPIKDFTLKCFAFT